MSPSFSSAVSQASKKNIDISPPKETTLTVDNTEIINIDGDLLLQIEDTTEEDSVYYRVSSVILKMNSAYFDKLLDSSKFSEGERVSRRIEDLRNCNSDWSVISTSVLPQVSISYVGQFPKGVSNRPILRKFFEILSFPNERPPDLSGTLSIALLAVVADRFGAIDSVARYINRKAASFASSTKESVLRQRLLVGLLLGTGDWANRYSAQLINSGSERWSSYETDALETDDPLWWNLPGGIEEELAYRRECILSTISSLQSYFLDLYTSNNRQCKLGYDSSPQCDSFQLGEMIRFFTRHGTLSLQSNITDQDYPNPCVGSLGNLIALFKQCPEYQIDKNHSHCGLRTRLMPALEHLERMLRPGVIGICSDCWKNDRRKYSWLETPLGGTWHFSSTTHKFEMPKNSCESRHGLIKAMFTADRRKWACDLAKR